MRRTLTKARFIKPSSIRIGDLVRITTTVGDMQMSNVGVVKSRQHHGRATDYCTAQGHVIGTDWQDGVSKITVTLLNRNDSENQLDGMEE